MSSLGRCLIALFVPAFLQAAPVELGTEKSEVLKIMGPPQGIMELPNSTRYLYESAELTLVDGKLTEAEWFSPEEIAAEKAIQEQQRKYWAAQQAEADQKHRERGVAILKHRQTDVGFLSLSAVEQFRAWQDFVQEYPEIDATSEYEAAFLAAKLEARELAKEKRQLAEEERQLAAQRQRERWQNTSLIDDVQIGNRGYPYWGYEYRPPVIAIAAPSEDVIVVGGSGKPYYNYAQSRPILDVSYKTDNFGIRYTSGSTTPLRRSPYVTPSQPVVIVKGQ